MEVIVASSNIQLSSKKMKVEKLPFLFGIGRVHILSAAVYRTALNTGVNTNFEIINCVCSSSYAVTLSTHWWGVITQRFTAKI
jgi:hypothetical protein